MEMAQVRYFLAACEAMSFTRAAEQCHVSQPALTVAIKKLEDELGGALFHREGKRILLTELGKLVKPYFTQLTAQAEVAREVADSFRRLRQTPLNLGVMATVGPLRLAQFLGRFRNEHPGVELAVHEGTLTDLLDRLDDGDIDLALLSSPAPFDPRLRAETLYTERYVVVFPPGHRFEALPTIRLEDVAGEPYVDRLSCELRDMVMTACRDRKVELYATFRSEREDWVQGMVLAGIGFAFMPEYSVTLGGMLSRPLADPPVARTISLVRMAGRQLSPAAAAFSRAAKVNTWPG